MRVYKVHWTFVIIKHVKHCPLLLLFIKKSELLIDNKMLKMKMPNNQKLLTEHLLHKEHCTKAGLHKKPQVKKHYLPNMFPNDYQIQFIYLLN